MAETITSTPSKTKAGNRINPGSGRKSFCPKLAVSLLVLFALAAGIAGGFVYKNLSDLPTLKALELYAPAESSRVYSSDGKLLAEFFVERRTFIPHYKIPEQVKKAFIAIEDVRFYNHPGVDFIGIARAFFHDIRTMSTAQGGSTITQQLAKMLFLKPERSLKRKLREIALSIQIEKHYTKDEILGIYLNQAYFGARAYGIEAAAQTYFGKPVNELTLGNAALLAAMPKAPSVYSPFKNPDKARERRSSVLRLMKAHNFITGAQYENADREPLPVVPYSRQYQAPFFIEMIRQKLEETYGSELYRSGYKIYTTIDSALQQAAEEAVKNGIDAIHKRTRTGVQAALIAMDPYTGAVKAMVGGTDFWESQFNRSTQALRQPGSAFKPFVYLTAIETGMKAEDLILDSPVSFKGARPGQIWSPKNYDAKTHGVVTLKEAFAKSLNIATVRLADKLGIDKVIETAQRLGIKSDLQPYLPLALGASDVKLLDMISAYAVFATRDYVTPLFYEKVVTRDNLTLDEEKTGRVELLAKEDADEMKKLLQAVIEEGTALKAKELKRTLYGKTGTTNEYTDAWFIGFDDKLVVGVWVGRDNHKPIGHKETGAKAALPIWMEFMKKAPLQTLPAQNP